jgi:hypothetical protein
MDMLSDYIFQEITGAKFNSLIKDQIWCKLIKKSKVHNGFEFKSNTLNVDTLVFNPRGYCLPGGIYCANIKDMHIWYNYGGLLTEPMYYYSIVSIPNDARVYVEPGIKVKTDTLYLNDFKVIWDDKKIVLDIIKNDGLAIQYVTNQTHELCLEAIKYDPFTLEYVKKQTTIICIETVKRNGLMLCCVKDQTPEICMIALKQNGLALEYVEQQTFELCIIAVKHNKDAMKYVNAEFRDQVLLMLISDISL